jgi:hypothetical protein
MNNSNLSYNKVPDHLKRVNGFNVDYHNLPLHQRAFVDRLVAAPTEWVITLPDGHEWRVYPHFHLDPASKGL